MTETLAILEEVHNSAKSKYEELEGRCQMLNQAIDTFQQELYRSVPASRRFDTLTPVDLSGCESHIERLVRIANANGGILNIPDAREIILRSGASKSDPHHLGSNILKLFRRYSEDWERVGPRDYRYKLFEEQPLEDQGGDDQ